MAKSHRFIGVNVTDLVHRKCVAGTKSNAYDAEVRSLGCFGGDVDNGHIIILHQMNN